MIICIDGPDFCGKDTLSLKLKDTLVLEGHKVIISAYHHPQTLKQELEKYLPAQIIESSVIKHYIEKSTEIIALLKTFDPLVFEYPDTIQLLYCAIHPLYKKMIQLLMQHKIHIIMPRSWTSAYAYHQGTYIANYHNNAVLNSSAVYHMLCQNLWPIIDQYIFIDLSETDLRNRKKLRTKDLKQTILKNYEFSPEFLLTVNKSYQSLAKKINALVIPSAYTVDEAIQAIMKLLKPKFNN